MRNLHHPLHSLQHEAQAEELGEEEGVALLPKGGDAAAAPSAGHMAVGEYADDGEGADEVKQDNSALQTASASVTCCDSVERPDAMGSLRAWLACMSKRASE